MHVHTEPHAHMLIHTHCTQCVSKCCEKFMNVTGRVGLRFSEFFSQMEAAAQAQMETLAKQQAGK